jgi:hypothetical protein
MLFPISRIQARFHKLQMLQLTHHNHRMQPPWWTTVSSNSSNKMHHNNLSLMVLVSNNNSKTLSNRCSKHAWNNNSNLFLEQCQCPWCSNNKHLQHKLPNRTKVLCLLEVSKIVSDLPFRILINLLLWLEVLPEFQVVAYLPFHSKQVINNQMIISKLLSEYVHPCQEKKLPAVNLGALPMSVLTTNHAP